MTKIEHDANQFIVTKRAEWVNLVALARKLPPKEVDDAAKTLALAADVGKSALKRKIQAIHAAMNEGLTDDRIIAMGQKNVMSKYVTEQKGQRGEPLVFIKIGCSPELRKEFMANLLRIGKILGITQTEQLLEFVNSVFSGLTEEDVKALAGEAKPDSKIPTCRVCGTACEHCGDVYAEMVRDGHA